MLSALSIYLHRMTSATARVPGKYVWMPVALALALTGCAPDNDRMAAYHGMKAIEKGDFTHAAELLARAANADWRPERAAEIRNHLGIALANSGDTNAALSAWTDARAFEPDMPEPIYNLGVVYMALGQTDKAAICFQEASDIMLSDIRALEFMSVIKRRHSDWNGARAVLTEALRRQPNFPRLTTAMGLTELEAGNTDKAISLFQHCLQTTPGYPPAVFSMGLARRKQNNLIQARMLFHEYTQLAGATPEQSDMAQKELTEINALISGKKPVPSELPPPRPLKAPIPPTPETLAHTADILARQGRAEAAVNNYILAARAAGRVGRNDIFQKMLRDATKTCADDARANYLFSLYLIEIKQPREALVHLKRAVLLMPEWFEAQMALANAAMEQSEFDTAVVSFKSAVKSKPENPDALWSLIQVYDRKLNLRHAAIKNYELFLTRFPNDARVRIASARLASMQSQQQDDRQ